jgi:hypothetical protein
MYDDAHSRRTDRTSLHYPNKNEAQVDDDKEILDSTRNNAFEQSSRLSESKTICE